MTKHVNNDTYLYEIINFKSFQNTHNVLKYKKNNVKIVLFSCCVYCCSQTSLVDPTLTDIHRLIANLQTFIDQSQTYIYSVVDLRLTDIG